MSGDPLWPYLLAWVPMLLLAIGNGFLREKAFAPRMPELRAHQLSTLTAGLVLGAFIALVVHLRPPASARQALLVGLLWVALTVVFEFGMGRLLLRRPWRELLRDYDLLAGRVWTLFLLWLLFAPWVLWSLQRAR